MVHFNSAVNLRLVLHLCGWGLLMLAIVFLIPLIPSFIMGDEHHWPFLKSSGITLLFAALLIFQGRKQLHEGIRPRDGLATVGLMWLLIGLFGTLPFLLGESLPNFWDALFESISGFSTTGATVIGEPQDLAPTMRFWRALTHWLGSMGIVVLLLAILPSLGLSGLQLVRNESIYGGQARLKPRLGQTARALWNIYLVLSIICITLLTICGVPFFDALCHGMSAIATGGFANHSNSITHTAGPGVEVIYTVFMFIGSLNFGLFYLMSKGNWKALWHDSETRVYTLIIVIATFLITISLSHSTIYTGESLLAIMRHAIFQVVSVISTTGFSTTDWEEWPHFAYGILFVLFFIGGCAGSTSGGIKCIRWILLLKGIHRTLRQHIHPRAVIPVRLGDKAVPETLMTAVWSFGAIYFLTLAASTLALAATDLDLLTALSASASALGNVGLGLSEVGPSDNWSTLPDFAKGVLCLNMFLGRLEFFAIMILLLPDFWRK